MVKNEKYATLLNIVLLICNLLICLMIIIAGIVLIKQNDTNGYFAICIGLQFFIMRSRKINYENRKNE